MLELESLAAPALDAARAGEHGGGDESDNSDIEEDYGDEDRITLLWDAATRPPPLPAASLKQWRAALMTSSSLSIPAEVARCGAVGALLGWLKAEARKGGIDIRTPMFERWLLTARHSQGRRKATAAGAAATALADPILPTAPRMDEAVLLGRGESIPTSVRRFSIYCSLAQASGAMGGCVLTCLRPKFPTLPPPTSSTRAVRERRDPRVRGGAGRVPRAARGQGPGQRGAPRRRGARREQGQHGRWLRRRCPRRPRACGDGRGGGQGYSRRARQR